MLFSLLHPLQKRHLHFLAYSASDHFVFGLYFLQTLLSQGLSMLLTPKRLHGNRPVHSFSRLLSELINLLKCCLTRALVEPFLRCHILWALRCQSFVASGIVKTHSILMLLLRRVSSVEQTPAIILVHSWISRMHLSSYMLLLKLLLVQLILIAVQSQYRFDIGGFSYSTSLFHYFRFVLLVLAHIIRLLLVHPLTLHMLPSFCRPRQLSFSQIIGP